MRSAENRFNAEFLGALEHVLDEVEADESAEALITTGNGRFYSNGLDLEQLAQPDGPPGDAIVSRMQRLFARLLGFPLATVAAIDGHAFAGGAMFALAHDARVMREGHGWLCINEVDLATGQPITRGMRALLAAKLPPALLHEMVFTGRRFDGADARAAELVLSAHPAEALLDAAQTHAARIGGKHRATLAALKNRLFEETIAELSRPDVFA